jgi:hypothetical protein
VDVTLSTDVLLVEWSDGFNFTFTMLKAIFQKFVKCFYEWMISYARCICKRIDLDSSPFANAFRSNDSFLYPLECYHFCTLPRTLLDPVTSPRQTCMYRTCIHLESGSATFVDTGSGGKMNLCSGIVTNISSFLMAFILVVWLRPAKFLYDHSFPLSFCCEIHYLYGTALLWTFLVKWIKCSPRSGGRSAVFFVRPNDVSRPSTVA